MTDEPSLTSTHEAGPDQAKPGRPKIPSVALSVRIALYFIGWLVVLVGVAGLVLPGIQGILTIVAGAAILSVASDRVHRWLQQHLQRWPSVGGRLDRLRHKLQAKLSRRRR